MIAAAPLSLAILLILAGQGRPQPRLDADPDDLAVGDEVIFSPGEMADANRVTFIASTPDLREMKHLEAFMAHRVVSIDANRLARVQMPTGAPIVPIPVGTPGVVEEIAEPGGPTNDARVARVRVADGPFQGRLLWVVTRRIARVGGGPDRAPGPGAIALLVTPNPEAPVAILADRAAVVEYLRAGAARDLDRFKVLLERERMAAMPDGSEVEVIGQPVRIGPERMIEVRPFQGPFRGRTAWVAASSLRSPEAITPPPPAPARSASATLLDRARDLEGQGRTEQARGCYRELLERFRDSPEAADASVRLRALAAGP